MRCCVARPGRKPRPRRRRRRRMIRTLRGGHAVFFFPRADAGRRPPPAACKKREMNTALTQTLWHIKALHSAPPETRLLPDPAHGGARRRPFANRSFDSLWHGQRAEALLHRSLPANSSGPCGSEPLTLLEIGILEGASLRLWRRFLPKATIVGVDVEPPALDLPGVEMYAGDQSDAAFLATAHRPLQGIRCRD